MSPIDDVLRSGWARRDVLAALGYGAGGLAAGSVLGGLLAGLAVTPAGADTALDVQILQTASSLEALAVAAYELALAAGTDRALNGTVTTFLTDTRRRHDTYKKAFQARTTALDRNAQIQDAPNPKFLPALTDADLSTADKVLDLTGRLEKVAVDTYLRNLTELADAPTRSLMASVMAVEAQHLATLRVFGALAQGGASQLLRVPLPQTGILALPGVVGSVAFPDALHQVGGTDMIAEPTSGALG
jgi:hypothetical protein